MPRDKVLAPVVRLLDTTLIRVGSEEYARENRSYGLTTLKKRHLKVSANTLRFQFRGKSGIEHDVAVSDARLTNLLAGSSRKSPRGRAHAQVEREERGGTGARQRAQDRTESRASGSEEARAHPHAGGGRDELIAA